MPFNSTPITVKDSNGNPKSIIAYSDGTSAAFAHPLLDNAGAIISPATAGNQATANAKLDALIGNTSPGVVTPSTTLSVTANSGYTSGMVVGGKVGLANAARAAGGSGAIQTVRVSKRTALEAFYQVFFFHTDPTFTTLSDRAAFDLAQGDLARCLGSILCDELVDTGTGRFPQASNCYLPFTLPGGTTLYAVPVLRGAETYATTDAVELMTNVIRF